MLERWEKWVKVALTPLGAEQFPQTLLRLGHPDQHRQRDQVAVGKVAVPFLKG